MNIPRFKYEEYFFNFEMIDCNEENLSMIICKEKNNVVSNEQIKIHILEIFEPTEIQ